MNREVYLINQVFFAYLPACMHARLHGNAGHTYTGRRPAAVWGLTVSTESYRYCYAEVVENDIRYMQSYNKQYVILKPRTKIGQGQLSRATARLSSFTKDSSRKKKNRWPVCCSRWGGCCDREKRARFADPEVSVLGNKSRVHREACMPASER